MRSSRRKCGARRPFHTTSDLAREAGVHPNTVRLYERWGFISPPQRTAKGYRMFTDLHLGQMLLARLALRFTWLSGGIRARALEVIHHSAAVNYDSAIVSARELAILVRKEKVACTEARSILESWANRRRGRTPGIARCSIGRAAEVTGTTIDTLRSWERNGLLRVPRNPANGYRVFGEDEIEAIRGVASLRRARHSTMSILNMMRRLEGKRPAGRIGTMDLPEGDENAIYATDRWDAKLADLEASSRKIIALLNSMRKKRA